MQKVNLPKVLNDLKIRTVKRSPEILTGIGIAGMITTKTENLFGLRAWKYSRKWMMIRLV